jgi:uncharacterized protein YuzE
MTLKVGGIEFDHVLYDEARDVLYLSVGDPRAAADEQLTPEGHVVRLDENGDVIGLTLINAGWIAKQNGEVSVSLPTPIAAEDLAPAFS